jgi:phage gpG-like protein
MSTWSSGVLVRNGIGQRNFLAAGITINFESTAGIFATKLDKLGMDIRSFREPLKRSVQQVAIPSIRVNFIKSGRPRWAELAPSTVAQKGGYMKPLIRTGALMRTMGYLNIWTLTKDRAFIADLPSSIWYGKVQQNGGGGGSRRSPGVLNPLTGKRGPDIIESGGGIPARPFVMLQDSDIPKIHKVFDDWLAERIARAGL